MFVAGVRMLIACVCVCFFCVIAWFVSDALSGGVWCFWGVSLLLVCERLWVIGSMCLFVLCVLVWYCMFCVC